MGSWRTCGMTSRRFRMPKLAKAGLLICGLAALTVAGNQEARGGVRCKPVHGFVQITFAPGPSCASPVGICFRSSQIGGIHANSEATVTSVTPSPDPTLPATILLTQRVVKHLDDGDDMFESAAGAFDVVSGDGVFLLTVTGGTGALTGATGHIVEYGRLDVNTFNGSTTYT